MYEPNFRMTPELMRLVVQATELKIWIGQAVVDVPWLTILQREAAVRLAHSSTAIEGNPLTLPEVEALARGENIVASSKAKQEALNYLGAMRCIWTRKVSGPVEEKDLLCLHKLLTQKTLSKENVGRYKIRQNRVVDAKGITVYTPPLPKEVRPLTQNLLSWVNSKGSKKLHPMITSAIAHHRLVSIHPFSDGNGRTARALGILLLYIRGFDTHHLFALDEYFEQDRNRYYLKIQQARDLDDDLSYWLEYVAQGIVQTLNRTKERILSLQVPSKGSRIILTKRQEDFLRFLRDRGRVRSPDLEKAFKLTRSRINQILKPLVDAGLVIQEGQTRATTYHLLPLAKNMKMGR